MSRLFSLEGRVALVTGASRGLGAAIATGLAEAGADVAVHGNTRSPEATCARVRALGRRALPVVGDMADAAVPDRLVAETIAGLGGL
ncbi:MAG TPA: SDR family NAD(P)-dependent oxidoreductase, partial [Vicinamibacteria bacterium]